MPLFRLGHLERISQNGQCNEGCECFHFIFSDGWLIDLQIDLDAFNGERESTIKRDQEDPGLYWILGIDPSKMGGKREGTGGTTRGHDGAGGSARETRENDWTRGNASKTRGEGSK
jgi:hypothetical protein